MRKTLHFTILLFSSFVLILFLFGAADSTSAEESLPVEQDPFTQAAVTNEQLSEYTFIAQIEQTLIPRAIPGNVGTTEEQVDSQLTAEVRGDYTKFTWEFEAAAQTSPIVMEQDGDKFFLLEGNERTEIQNPLAGLAPTTDFGTYLRAAQNIRPSATTHPDFAVYDFDISGDELTDLILAETGRYLTREQQAAVAINTTTIRKITGAGQLFIDADGLPRRQILTLNMPEVNEQYDARTHLTVDYQYTTAPAALPLIDQTTSAPAPVAPIETSSASLMTAVNNAISADWFIALVGLAVVIAITALIVSPHRYARVAVPVSVAAVMFFTPFLQPVAIAYQHQLVVNNRPDSLPEALGVEEDSDLAAAEEFFAPAAVNQLDLANNADQCGAGDDTLDTDGDGLSDFVENCLGTNPFDLDTDNDGLTDTLEVNGFVFTDTVNITHTIYTNPHEADSNQDGLTDNLEWTEPGFAPSADMDGDDIPNVWDFDNDGDLIPDSQDLDPYAVTAYQPSFSIVTNRDGDNFSGFQYIDIQVQPQNKDNLRLSLTALDWPYDETGSIQARDYDNLGELTFTPQLRIVTNKAPFEYLLSDYGISAVKNGNTYEMYVPLSPVTDGGQITGFSTRVVYDLRQFTTLNWSNVEFVWTALMEASVDDSNRTSITPVAVYAEPAFRMTGLQITKNGAQNVAAVGTPAQQTNHRQLANTIFGTSTAFLNDPELNLDALVGRLLNPATPIEQTWGVPVSDLAVSSVSAPHPDAALTGFFSTFKLTDDFLKANSYDVNEIATLIIATEGTSGFESLEDAADLSTNTFTFSLANIATQTMRSVSLSHYQYTNNTTWSTVEPDEILEDLLGYYDDATFEAIRNNLNQTYPLLDLGDIADVMVGFYIGWSAGQISLISLDGTILADAVSDQAITQQFDLPTEQDFVTYLIEAQEFGVAGQGLIFESRQALHEYETANRGKPAELVLAFTSQTVNLMAEISSFYVASNFDLNGRNVPTLVSNKIRDGRYRNLVRLAKKKYRLVNPSSQQLAQKVAQLRQFRANRFSNFISKQNFLKRIVLKTWQNFAKYSAIIGKVLGVTVQVVLLGWSLYNIWKAFDDFTSPYAFERQFALGTAITSTIIEVALSTLSLVAILATGLVSTAATVLAAVFGIVFLFVELLGVFVKAGSNEANSKIGDSLVATALVKLFFGDVQLKTELRGVNFAGADFNFNQTGFAVAGSTLTVSDSYRGRIEGFQYKDRLEKSDTYAYFTASAGPNIAVSTTDTRNEPFRCSPATTSSNYCRNDLNARFTFQNAGLDQRITFKYNIFASLEYTKYILGGLTKQEKSEQVYMPDELAEEDRWEATTLYFDVLPATLPELLVWSELQNYDKDADGLSDSAEADAKITFNVSDPDGDLLSEELDWDSDNDGLSDGFEQATANVLGAVWYTADTDNDGLDDGTEYDLVTSPNLADTDSDGLTDGQEVYRYDGTSWGNGGWFINIGGTQYWTFSDPRNADSDGDTISDASEKANGTSPYAFNSAPLLTVSAGPTVPDNLAGVYTRNGDTITTTLNLNNIGTGPINTTVNVCMPDAVTNITAITGGDRQPATQTAANCRSWDFSANPLQLFQTFQVTMTAQATSATITDTITASVSYDLNGTPQTIDREILYVQDNTAPVVLINDPTDNTILTSEFYVIGGSTADADSFIERVEVTVDNGTHTAVLTDAEWGYTWQLPAEGDVTITAVAYDVVGNVSAADSVQVTVDTLAPTITVNLADNTTISAGQALSTSFPLNGTVTDNAAGVERVQLRYNDGPWRTIWDDNSQPLSANWNGLWEIPTVETAQGEHKLELRAYDAYGNVGTTARTVFIDVLPPTNDLTNRAFIQSTPRHVPAGPLEILGVASDAGNNPLPADPAELAGTLNSIEDATIWLQVDNLAENDAGATVNWIGDVNGDRLGDLAVGLPAANGGTGRVVVVNGSAGDWPVPAVGDLEFLENNTPSYIGTANAAIGSIIKPAGDVNADGLDDFLIGDPANERLILILGDTNASASNDELDGSGLTEIIIESTDPSQSLAGLTANQVSAAGDVNNDGLSDILISVTGVTNTVYLLAGELPFTQFQPFNEKAAFTLDTGATGASVAGVGDVNDDFIDDFAIAFGNTVYLFSGSSWVANSQTTLTTASAIATFNTADSLPTIVAAGDLNGDNIADFAFTSGSDPVVVFGNNANSFSTQTLSGYSGFLSAVGDVDKDGRSDLLLGNGDGNASLLSGTDLNTLAATIEGVETAASAPYISGADLAGDGSSDLALVPTAAVAAALGYDGFGSNVQAPFIPRNALPTSNPIINPVAVTAPNTLLPGDVTVAPIGGDYASIQAAIDSGATRVLIEPGIYAESFTLANDVTIIGSGADRTILTVPNGTTNTTLITANAVTNATLLNLTILGEGDGTALSVSNGASNIELSRTVVQGFETAVAVDGSATTLALRNNTIVGNVVGFLATNNAGVDVLNTIFAYNSGTALQYDASTVLELHQFNLYFANGTDLAPNNPGGGELFSNPLFNDYASGDFRTAAFSPVIDAGSPNAPVPPGAGNAVDIGHIEQASAGFFIDADYCSACANDGLIWGVNAFNLIQDGVDAALSDLDSLRVDDPVVFTVGVNEGVYTETVVISGSVNLVGRSPDTTAILGNGGPAVTFDAAVEAGVSGFTLMGGGAEKIGVLMAGGSNTIDIRYNLIKNNSVGISVTQRATGLATFNTIIDNVTGVEVAKGAIFNTELVEEFDNANNLINSYEIRLLSDSCYSVILCEERGFVWLDTAQNIISNNTNGLVANGKSVIFTDNNLLFNTVDYTNVVAGVNDIVGQDPLLTTANGYLTIDSPALDAVVADTPVPPGGGLAADIGWHELLAAPLSIFMGQPDNSVATASSGVGQVEYAIVEVVDPTSPVTSTLPATWETATLDNPGETLTYWRATADATNNGSFYRVYSRATDLLGNTETDVNEWFDGAFYVDGNAPGVTLTVGTKPFNARFDFPITWRILEVEVNDYIGTSFDVSDIYFVINGERVDGQWRLDEWQPDGTTPRVFYYLLRNTTGTIQNYTIDAVVVDGAGNQTTDSASVTVTGGASQAVNTDIQPPNFVTITSPYAGQFVEDTVTVNVTTGDYAGVICGIDPACQTADSGVQGVEVSFDGGRTWSAATYVGLDEDDVFSLYTFTGWTPPADRDATTIPVRVRATDYFGLSTTRIVTITIDTAGPRLIGGYTFNYPEGTYLEDRDQVTATLPPTADGSGFTSLARFVPDENNDPISVSLENGQTAVRTPSERTFLDFPIGAADEFLNFTGEYLGTWYGGGDFIQSIRMDGVLNIDKSEWFTATERLDDDFRTGSAHTLWATWDFEGPYIAYQGASWGPDGQLWAYLDTRSGVGSNQPIAGTATLPFDADMALQAVGPGEGYYWTYNDGLGVWERESEPLFTQESADFDFREYGHDPASGTTEMHKFDIDFQDYATNLDTHRLFVYALDTNLESFSAFPTANSLDGNFQYFYEWPNVTQESDLLKLPVAARQPAVTLDITSNPENGGLVSTDKAITYVAELTNEDSTPIDNLQLLLSASNGLTYQSVSGAAASDCAAGDSCIITAPTIPVGEAVLITIEASTSSDLTSIDTITTSAFLQAELPVANSGFDVQHNVDVTSPEVDINTNPGNAIGIGLVQISGSASDLGGGVDFVEVSLDGVNWQSASGTSLWTAEINAPDLPTWQLFARATDVFGQTSAVIDVTFVRDTTAPAITADTPPAVLGPVSYQFRGTTSDSTPAGARTEFVEVQFDDASNEWFEATLTDPFSWFFLWGLPTEDGVTHTVRFRATDYAGNTTTTSFIEVIVDTVAPQITVDTDLSAFNINNDTLNGTVSDGREVASMSITIYPAVGDAIVNTITPNGDGTWAYELNQPEGIYTAYIRASDGINTPAILGPVTLNNAVMPNIAPVAVDDTASTDQNQAVTIDVLANDTDADNDALSIVSVTQPVSGTAVISGSVVIYTPALDFNGVDTFTYVASDSQAQSNIATVTVTVNEVIVNTPPVAVDDIASTDQNQAVTIEVLANDTDADNDALSIVSVTQPVSGTAVISGSVVIYTPVLDFNGIDTFTYVASDSQAQSNIATVTVTVNGIIVNTPPVAVDDTASTDENTAVVIDVLTNDTDADNDSLTLFNVTQPINGVAIIVGTQVVYTPTANFNGTETFTYSASDGQAVSNSATVTVTVDPVNTAPTQTQPVTLVVVEGQSVMLELDSIIDDVETAVVDLVWQGTIANPAVAQVLIDTERVATISGLSGSVNGTETTLTLTVTDSGDPDGCNSGPCSTPLSTTIEIPVTVILELPSNSGQIDVEVWDDLNGDGRRQNSEPRLDGVAIHLLDAGTGDVVYTDLSSDGVSTLFGAPGSYRVKAILPDGNHAFTLRNQGNNENIDSDVNRANGQSDTINLAENGLITSVDVGLWTPATVETAVWDDLNGDGRRQNSERLVTVPVTVRLLDNDNNILFSTETVDGVAMFTNVPADTNVKLEFVTPEGYVLTLRNQGNNENIDSDASRNNGRTSTFKSSKGAELITNVDAGMWSPATVQAEVWDDLNGDGRKQNSEPLILIPVTVNLLDSGNNFITTTTTVDGIATFTGVPADTSVKLEFVMPDGYVLTLRNQGNNENIDSDARRSNGRTNTFKSSKGAELITNVDAGVWSPATIQAEVWDDLNGNGRKQNSDPLLLVPVTVNLLDSDNTLLQTTTSVDGIATFTNVPADTSVKLEFVVPNGYVLTLRNKGKNENIDSDANRKTGRTNSFKSSQGAELITNIDAGFWRLASGNADPVLTGDTVTINEDTEIVIDVLSNDEDVNDDPLVLAEVSEPPSGDADIIEVSEPLNGRVVITNSSILYSPDINYYGLDTFTYTIEDGQGGRASSAITVTINPMAETLYLPMISQPSYPDLVVAEVIVTADDLAVVIENIGTATVDEDFYVDAYIGLNDPAQPPTMVNDIWPNFSPQGIVWGVTDLVLEPGESLTLRLADGYQIDTYSSFESPLVASTPVYVQVDSAASNTNYGGILETHEALGRPYNNLFGPVRSP